ncbi:MAG: serine/threonine protein kinase [Kofleriaceae bacterium]
MSILAGRYELERRLGGGGMAEVFLARLVGKDGFSRQVAIKRVLAHLATDESFAKMFVAEAQMCARLQHPNIVSVLDFDRDEEGRPFLVIELVDGPSLAELADAGALPVGAAVHVATELLRGLAYAHDLPSGEGDVRGIVHRDISPHNVLLSWEGAVKLSDFGIAKARAASGVTASELLKGKPAYMSPEQANGEALDGRSDLFSVGIVLWELLVGRTLFSGHTTQETLARVLFAPVPSPRSIRTEIPEDVDAVVMKLLAREKSDRYADANDAVAALVACKDFPRDGREKLVALLADRFAANAPQRARVSAEVPTVRAQYAPTLPAPRDATRSPSRPWLFVLGAITLTSIAVAVTVIALGRREPRDAPAPAPIVASIDAAVIDAASADAAVTAVANAANDAAVDGALDAARDAAPEDPQRIARAAARAKLLKAQSATGKAPFPLATPTSVKPEELHARARKEAERLFGKVYDSWFSWDGIRPDGTVDTTTETLWMKFGAANPEGDRNCLRVEASKGAATVSLLAETCPRGTPPRCTARQLHDRAAALGVPADAVLQAGLSASHDAWEITSKVSKTISTPNDCTTKVRKSPSEEELAAERARIVEAGKGRGDVPFPVPNEASVDPTAYFESARKEVARLFGTRGRVVGLSFSGMGPDGTVDIAKLDRGFQVAFAIEPPTADGFRCVQFSSNYANTGGRSRMMLVKSEQFCRGMMTGASTPRCSSLELYGRAVVLGLPEGKNLDARLRSGEWFLTNPSGANFDFSGRTPNDCH